MLKKLKSLKSLFIIEEPEATSQARDSATDKPVEVNKNPTSTTRPIQVTPTTSGPGKVQDKFLDVLFGALEASNQEGFDYMEFKDFLRSLANVPMDDSTRYKSAFATAQTMGATRDKIVASARTYLSILGKEEAKFQEALEGQKQKNLTGKQDEIKQLEQSIRSKEAEIERMKAEMEQHRSQIQNLEQEINAASEKLAQTASDFAATYHALQTQIEHDIQQIETHL